MELYLWANDSFALKADGEYMGIFNAAKITDFNGAFIEAYPQNIPAKPLCMPIKSDFAGGLSLANGLGVKLNFLPEARGEFKLLGQKRVAGTLVTAYSEGRARVCVENSRSVETAELPFVPKGVTIEEHGNLAAVYTEGLPCFLALFRIGENVQKLYANIVDDFEISPLFRTKTRLFDIERTTVEVSWDLSSMAPTVQNIRREAEYERGFGDKFLTRALFYRLLHGLDPSPLLVPEMRKNAPRLKEYLGEFTEVLPDFLCEDGVCVAAEGERKYAKYFAAETQYGLISNVRPL